MNQDQFEAQRMEIVRECNDRRNKLLDEYVKCCDALNDEEEYRIMHIGEKKI